MGLYERLMAERTAAGIMPAPQVEAGRANPANVFCPHCKAGPGHACKRPSGHAVPFGEYHKGRQKLASAQAGV